MNKLAIFVEGQTEQLFVERLLDEIAGKKQVRIEKRKAKHGKKEKRRIRLIEASAPDSGQKYFVLIVDCGQDERVKSDIKERYEGLVKSGYEAIIGIRDVLPHRREDIQRLRGGLQYGLRTLPIQVVFVLAVMEIEAWFIAEHTHFLGISDELTLDRMKTGVGFDPSTDDIELRHRPADDLDKIYRLAGYTYHKSKSHVQRTVGVLDYARIYLELGQEIADLKALVESVDRFLTDAPGD